MSALVSGRAAVRVLGSASMRRDAVDRRGTSCRADLFWAKVRNESRSAEGAPRGAPRGRAGRRAAARGGQSAAVDTRRRGAQEQRRVIDNNQQPPESTLHAATTARPTTRRFQSIPRDPDQLL